MTPLEWTIYAAIAIAGLCGSSLFSGIETGIYTLNRVRLKVRVGRNDPAARRLNHEMNHPNRLLSTLLISNNMANYAGSFGLAGILGGLQLGDWQQVIISALVLTPTLFVVGETLPKDLFRTHTDVWTYALSGLLKLVRILLTIVLLLPFVQAIGDCAAFIVKGDRSAAPTARLRMAALIKESAGKGVLSESQMTLADRALAMRTTSIASELVPWSRVKRIHVTTAGNEREALLRESPYTRLPVVGERGEVVGILSVLDAIIESDQSTEALMTTALELPTDLSVTRALRQFRQHHCKMAIAIDPTTKIPRGIVTLKDLVEPLTGELPAW